LEEKQASVKEEPVKTLDVDPVVTKLPQSSVVVPLNTEESERMDFSEGSEYVNDYAFL
jgi:hypothetical protein